KLRQTDRALADAAAAIKAIPNWTQMYLLRANLFRSQGKKEAALAEAAAVAAANPDESYAHVTAANIYSALDKKAEAVRAYDRAIAIKPQAYIYLNRARNRAKEDRAGRRADLDAALRLDPDYAEALAAKAGLQLESGDEKGGRKSVETLIAADPDNAELLIGQ